jgi:hypothetical protein
MLQIILISGKTLECDFSDSTYNYQSRTNIKYAYSRKYYSCSIFGQKPLSNDETYLIDRSKFNNVNKLDEALYIYNSYFKALYKSIFTNFPDLNCLVLQNLADLNEIKPEHFKGAKNLKKFWSYENPFRNLHYNIFSTALLLENLTLEKGTLENISESAFAGLNQLKKLHISENQIKVLPTRVFHWLLNLEELFLDFNKLNVLGKDLFKKNLKLKILLLNNNQIFAIHPEVALDNEVLLNVNLTNNKCTEGNFQFFYGNLKRLSDCMNNYTLIKSEFLKDDEYEYDLRIIFVFAFQGVIFVSSIILFAVFGSLFKKLKSV